MGQENPGHSQHSKLYFTELMKLLVLSIFMLISSICARSSEQFFDVDGKLTVDGKLARREGLAHWQSNTQELDVPADHAETLSGFDIGFALIPGDGSRSYDLDAIRITHCSYGVYHLNTATGIETPVLKTDGSPMINENIDTFGSESSDDPGPIVFTSTFGTVNDPPNSPTGSPIGTRVEHVGLIFITKFSLRWGFVPDFTRPTIGKGYVVHFDIRLVPTYSGVEYPEQKIRNPYAEYHFHDDVSFRYQVVDVPLPNFVSLNPFTWGQNNDGSPEQGIVLEMSGTHLEYFILQRSSDMINWIDFPFGGEGGDWSWPYTIPFLDGYLPNVYHWTLFDMKYSDERHRPEREFYRMVWTGQRAVRRSWSPTQEMFW